MPARRSIRVPVASILVWLGVAGVPLLAETWFESHRLEAADAQLGDYFGWAVSLSADTALVGAHGIDAEEGAAYVYRLGQGVWREEAKLVAPLPSAADSFAQTVALDGEVAAVGAWQDDELGPNFGAVHLFRRAGTTWTHEAKVFAEEPANFDGFGWSLDLEGDLLVVGAPGDDAAGPAAGAVWVFRHDGESWVHEAALRGTDTEAGDSFGEFVALDGGRVLVGATRADDACPQDPSCDSGAAYLFVQDASGRWVAQARLTAGDAAPGAEFGQRLDLSGRVALVEGGGAVYAYDLVGSDWLERQRLETASDGFGSWIAIDGSRALIGAAFDDTLGTAAGTAYVYADLAGEWRLVAQMSAADTGEWDEFGLSLDLEGNRALVGAFGGFDYPFATGAAYIFEAASTPLLRIAGACPGRAEITLDAATPDARAVSYFAPARGDAVLIAGPCAGVGLGLSMPTRRETLELDGEGSGQLELRLSPGACSRFAQAVDLTTCAVSNVLPLGGFEP